MKSFQQATISDFNVNLYIVLHLYKTSLHVYVPPPPSALGLCTAHYHKVEGKPGNYIINFDGEEDYIKIKKRNEKPIFAINEDLSTQCRYKLTAGVRMHDGNKTAPVLSSIQFFWGISPTDPTDIDDYHYMIKTQGTPEKVIFRVLHEASVGLSGLTSLSLHCS